MTSIRNFLVRAAAAIVAVTAGLQASSAAAQGIDGVKFEAEIGVASDNIGKGLGKNNGEISPFVTLEVGRAGAYARVNVAPVETAQGADAEIISAVGYRSKVGAFKVDAQVMNRELSGSRPGYDRNIFEYQVDLSRPIGPVKTRLRVNYTPDGFGATQRAWWTEVQGSVPVGDKTVVSAAVADRTARGGTDYVAWNVGAKHTLADNVQLDVRWYDTDSPRISDAYDGKLVASLSFSF